MLENVQQKTIEPLIKKALIPGTLIYTDEYNIYGRLEAWGYAHAVVHHGQRGWHVNTIDGQKTIGHNMKKGAPGSTAQSIMSLIIPRSSNVGLGIG